MLHHRTYSRDAVEKPIKSVINKMLISPNSNWSTNSKLQCPGSPPPNTNTITASIPTISQARRAFFTWRASATPKPCGIRIVALQKLQKHVTLPIMSEPTSLADKIRDEYQVSAHIHSKHRKISLILLNFRTMLGYFYEYQENLQFCNIEIYSCKAKW